MENDEIASDRISNDDFNGYNTYVVCTVYITMYIIEVRLSAERCQRNDIENKTADNRYTNELTAFVHLFY